MEGPKNQLELEILKGDRTGKTVGLEPSTLVFFLFTFTEYEQSSLFLCQAHITGIQFYSGTFAANRQSSKGSAQFGQEIRL